MLFSKLSIFGIISTVGVSMFPFILPSSADPRSSLTVWDASSSHQTLFIMLVATIIFLPMIVAYTSWVYKVLWGKVDEKSVTDKTAMPTEGKMMWYFAWILGLPLAAAFAVLNAMWYELMDDKAKKSRPDTTIDGSHR